MKETLQHTEAYEYYYGLAEKRSYPQVASRFSVSVTSVKKWAKAFSWQERIEQRDMENSRLLEKKTNNTIVNEKANYRKIIKAAIGKFVKNLQEGKVDVATVQDAERLVKLDLLLMGEATDRGEVDVKNPYKDLTTEELRKLIKNG